MRSSRRGWLVRTAPLALLVGSAALAADNRPEAELPFAKQANLSAQETLAQAKEYVSNMQDTHRKVVALQDKAKVQKDIIKLNCVNDKLLQVRGHIAVADKAMTGLNDAIARSDEPGRQHEFGRITIIYQKVSVLGTEAGNCVGEEIFTLGEGGRVEVEVDPSIPAADVTDPGMPQLDLARPPQASPTV